MPPNKRTDPLKRGFRSQSTCLAVTILDTTITVAHHLEP
jgi:hypothetical protein